MKTMAAVLSLLLGGPLPVQAREAEPSVKVSYVDLDLRSEAGVAVLDHRLERAIDAACRPDEGPMPPSWRLAVRRCARAKWVEIAPPRVRAIEGWPTLRGQAAIRKQSQTVSISKVRLP
ncbi:UrcA family protein [Novosphingobium sp. 9U]|uniref:UrcA family protein n=1 Tax=Novosphingobium sp. 9U TaxID=2653158 RepID=UPI001359C837|nr:UrcA family protein [Novosphingobium sp. 9U]